MIQELIKNSQILNIYSYGSRVYNCFTEKSDYDYVAIVVDNYENFVDNIEHNNIHVNFYKLSNWKIMIAQNNIETLECLSLNSQFIIKETIKFNLIISIIELRKSISKVCSNSYDKCRKKLIIEKDYAPYVAKKSLWHCIRILLFGIQCCKYGKIIDYTEANKYYKDIILNDCNDWQYYKDNWNAFCNNLRSEFRKYTEKEWTEYKNNEKYDN